MDPWSKNPCIHVSTNLILNSPRLVKDKFPEEKRVCRWKQICVPQKIPTGWAFFQIIRLFPDFWDNILGWTVTETDLSMEKEDFRDETGRRLLEKGTPG
jgi:hypothetical protein